MKKFIAMLAAILLLASFSGCAGLGRLEKTGSATGLSDWTTGSQFSSIQANILKASIDDNYGLISAVEQQLNVVQGNVTSMQNDLASAVSSLTASIGTKQNTVPIGTNASVIEGTSTTSSLWSAYQLALAAQIHGGGTSGGGTTTFAGGWDYTPRTGVPTGLLPGQVYMVDRTSAWNPCSSIGTTNYLVMYNGSTFLPLLEASGGPVVLGSAPTSPVAGWYYWAQAGGAWDPDPSVPSSDPYMVYYTGIAYVTIQGRDGTLYVNEGAPYDINWSILAPETDDVFFIKVNGALTLYAFGGIVDPGGSGASAVFDVQECDNTGSSCSSILSSTVTAGHSPTAGTLSDTGIAEGAFLKIVLGTVTGTPDNLLIYGDARGEY